MMKRIIFALALAVVSTTAQADTATLDCPSSLKEGGLVAQAVNCPSPDLPIGYPYCEYRDGSGQDTWIEGAVVGPKRVESVSLTIDATTAGTWHIQPASTTVYLYGRRTGGYQLGNGDTVDIDFKVYAVGNYRGDGNTQGMIGVFKPGNQDVNNPDFSCTMSIIDDDNSYYIGQRRQHPYGGVWQTTPHCFTRGCAWD